MRMFGGGGPHVWGLTVNFPSLIRFYSTKLDLKLMVTMNCILHTTVGLVHSPGAPPTSFTYLLTS